MEVMADTNSWDDLTEPWGQNEEIFKDFVLSQGSFSIIGSSVISDGEEVISYGLRDEESKININKADQELLKSFLEVVGDITAMEAAEIAAAIEDWRDEGDEILTGGAENSYYSAQNPAYPCANVPFGSKHELLLVKGVEEGLFLKLENYITTYGAGKVNINTADPFVFESLARSVVGSGQEGIESLTGKILKFREAGNFFSQPSASVIISELNDFMELEPSERSILSRMMKGITIGSACFGGVAEGKIKGSDDPDSWITFIFDRNKQKIVKWHEQ